MSQGRSFPKLLRDRIFKTGFYDTPTYWDMKANAYEGLARSCWPSNTFNRHWDARQMQIVDMALGDVDGLDIVDIACGTGRASRHLANKGAKVVGLDFAKDVIDVAKRESREFPDIDYRARDVLAPPDEDLVGRFDIALVIGCLTVACVDARDFDRGLSHIASMLRPAGQVLFIEPMHRSRLLRRILRMNEREWLLRCRMHGFELVRGGGMGLVPVRLAFAFRELPDGIVGPVFKAGEKVLDSVPMTKAFADYRWLLLRR